MYKYADEHYEEYKYNKNNSKHKPLNYNVSVPLNLAKSLEGKYFVANVENVTFGKCTGAWARLYNPPDSGVNLHVTVWTVTNLTNNPFLAQLYYNSVPPKKPKESSNVSTSNFTLCPLPRPKVQVQYASNVTSDPRCGFKSYTRVVSPESTMADDEEGKFIFPPGDSFLVFLTNVSASDPDVSAKLAFGWYEEPICK